MEQQVVSGIAYAKDEAKVSLIRVEDKPGVAARIFGPLAEANINVDMIVQNTSSDGKHTDMTFTVQESDLARALEVLKGAKKDIGYFDVKSSSDVAKVSVIGVGMRSHAGVAAQMFKALAEKGINILAITTSEIKISVLIDAAYAELAVRTLHALYEPGQRLISWALARAASAMAEQSCGAGACGPLEAAAARLRMAPDASSGKWRRAAMQNRGGDSPRISPSEPALRIILRRLREIMAEPSDGQSRLDKIVRQIAGLMVAEVCSIYLKRQDGSLELFATEGLNPAAVHNTFMKRGEGLVGRCAELAVPINEPDAQNHPAFSYRPETGEEIYHSFLAVPILRGGDVLGVLTVQNKTHKEYSDEDVEVLQTTAMVLAEHLVSGAVAGANAGAGVQPRRRPRGARPAAVGGPGARPRRAARGARRRHRARVQGPGGGEPPARGGRRGAEGLHRRDAGAGRAVARPASTATCSRPTACSPTTAAGSGA